MRDLTSDVSKTNFNLIIWLVKMLWRKLKFGYDESAFVWSSSRFLKPSGFKVSSFMMQKLFFQTTTTEEVQRILKTIFEFVLT